MALVSDRVKEDAVEVAGGLVRREGAFGWLLVAQTVIVILVLGSASVLLLDLRAAQNARLEAQEKLYQQLVQVTAEAIRQEQAARTELLAAIQSGERAMQQSAIALNTLTNAIKDRREFDTLVFKELQHGSRIFKDSHRVLKALLEQVKAK